jgi:hypothetical protein
MKLMFLTFIFVAAFAVNGFAQPKTLVDNSGKPSVYIAPMDYGFDDFLVAAFLKQRVPFNVVVSDEKADYVITGSAVKEGSRWHDPISGERDRNQASIKLVKVADKSIVWAGSAGDKSFFTGSFSTDGMRKVAERLAKLIRKEYFGLKK